MKRRARRISRTCDSGRVLWGRRDKTLNGEEQIPLLKRDLNLLDEHIHLLPEGSHLIQEEMPDHLAVLIDRAVKGSS